MYLAGANQHQLPPNGFEYYSRSFYFTFNALLVPLISFVHDALVVW
ncbi:hypothetical protein M8C21_011663 [Ambrosia artemisiifolia]|uniref:Uncharacterized protein n=1 Tax=Ambrosia artemisiifolia TaxID=4212 RepID=A0AAD5D594_AMBAR|nr:hypothetical protein M8C21_011663 [Ambrosia artemisiifolia]